MIINKLHNSIKSIDSYAGDWQRNAEIDAFGVILVDSIYHGGKWDVAEFFATGEEEIGRVFKFMERKSIIVPSGPFLDFGCGIGRISKALRKKYGNGFGIDVAPKMIELACEYVDGVEFFVNQTDSLGQFSDNSIGFIYSHIVLQHIPNIYQKRYIEEFLRILKPGGLAVFQIPIQLVNPKQVKLEASYRVKQILKHWFPFLVRLKRWLSGNIECDLEFKIEMHVLAQDIIEEVCRNGRCFIEARVATNSCDVGHRGKLEVYDLAKYRDELINSKESNLYLSCMYFVRKPHEH